MTTSERRTALWTTCVGAAVFVVVAVWFVPWNPVPGGALDPLDPRSAFSDTQIERAESYARLARIWSWGSLAVSLAMVCWLAFSRRGRALFERLPGPWWAQVPLAVAMVEVLRRIVTLPFAVLLRHKRLDEGLTNQSWGGFAGDLVKSELVDIVVTSLALVAVVACARRWRRAWPAVAAAGLGLFVLAGSFVYPLVIEPLFNDFEPLPDGSLRTQIMALADEEGVHLDDVLVADASRRTAALNAYVSGFGGTRRVVVYDTLVDDLSEKQTLAVVAHELVHARRGDVVTGSVLGAAGVVTGVGLLALALAGLGQRGRLTRGGAAVPVVLALVSLATLVSSPVESTISRQLELRADVDALRATEDSETFKAMQVQLAVHSLADPTPPAWSQFWFGTHPTVLTRMALADRMARD